MLSAGVTLFGFEFLRYSWRLRSITPYTPQCGIVFFPDLGTHKHGEPRNVLDRLIHLHQAAEESNAENLLVNHDPKLAKR